MNEEPKLSLSKPGEEYLLELRYGGEISRAPFASFPSIFPGINPLFFEWFEPIHGWGWGGWNEIPLTRLTRGLNRAIVGPESLTHGRERGRTCSGAENTMGPA